MKILGISGVLGHDASAALIIDGKIVKDDISYLPLHHQVISWAAKSNVNVPIRPNNEPLFKAASFN